MGFYDAMKSLEAEKNNGAKEKKTGVTSGASGFAAAKKILEEENPIDKVSLADRANAWIDRYNAATKGISDYATAIGTRYTRDVSGGYGSEIDKLLSEYAANRSVFDGFELGDAYEYLKELQGQIRDGNAYMQSFGSAKAYYDDQVALRDYEAQQEEVEAHRASTREKVAVQNDLDSVNQQLEDFYRENPTFKREQAIENYNALAEAGYELPADIYENMSKLDGLLKNQKDLEEELGWAQYFADETDMKNQMEWVQKYAGQSYSQLQQVLGDPSLQGTQEYEWVKAYAPSTMTDDDRRAVMAENEKQIAMLERVIAAYTEGNELSSEAGIQAAEAKRKALDAQYGSQQAVYNQIQELRDENWRLGNELAYGSLEQNQDFSEKSGYVSTKTDRFFTKHMMGYDDLVYEYINAGDSGLREEILAKPSVKTNPWKTHNFKRYEHMEPGEIAKYNYLYATQGKDAANDYLKVLEYELNSREMAKYRTSVEGDTKGFLKSSALLGLSVPMNLIGGVAGMLDTAGQRLVNNTKLAHGGAYAGPVDYNTASVKMSVGASTIRNTVVKNVADKTGTINLNPNKYPTLSRVLNGKSLGDLIQLGMSSVDSVAVGALATVVGPAAFTLLAGSAGTQGMLDAVANGANDNQAITIGLLNGAFEMIFEKVSIDKLLGEGSGKFIKDLLMQGVTEGSEEAFTSIANMVADITVMAEKSDWQKGIDAYIDQGMNPEQAKKEAFLDAAIQIGWDFAGGMISGGMMEGGKFVYNSAAQKSAEAKVKKAQKKLESQTPANPVAETVQQPNIDIDPNSPQGQILRNMTGEQTAQTVPAQTQQPAVEIDPDSPQGQIIRNWGGEVQSRTIGTAEQQEQVARLSKITGREVVLFEGERNRNGYFSRKDGKIHINVNGVDPVVQIFSHELTHSVEGAKIYNSLKAWAFDSIQKKGGNLAQLKEKKIRLYEREGEHLDSLGAEKELVAEYVSQYLLTDEQTIMEVCRSQPTLGRQILNWIDRFLSKLGVTNADRAALEHAKLLYSKALNQTRGSFNAQTSNMKTTRGTSQQVAADDVSQWRELQDFRDKAKQSLEAGEMTEAEYDQMMDIADEWESQLMGKGDTGLQNSISSDVQYSIAVTTDGRKVAVVDSDILKDVYDGVWNITKKRQAQAEAKRVLLKFKDGISVDGIEYAVNRISRREYTRSNDTDRLYRKNKDAFADKMRMANNVDDVIIATTDWKQDGGLNYPREDNFVDFIKGNTLMMSGDAKYTAKVVVGIEDTGRNVFYDVEDISPTDFTIKETEPSSTATTNKSVGDILEGSVEKTLSQPGADVKQFSISDTSSKQDVVSGLKDILRRGGDVNELRQYVAQVERNATRAEQNAPRADQNTREAEHILESAKQQGISVEEYLSQNWERYETESGWDPAARKALEMEQKGDRQYSFAGKNALTADDSLLASAKQMRLEGTDAETIRQETGWFVGYDGKWRYEINDAEMQVIKNLTSPKFYKYIDGEALKLEDIIKHDALFDAYPELRNMTVCLKRTLGKNVVGSYDSNTDTLNVSASIYLTDDMVKEMLIHEIQHKIQNIEGFARGSSPVYWETKGIGEVEYERFVANSEREKARILKGLTSEERQNYLRYVETDRQIKAALDAVDMEAILRGDDSNVMDALNSVDTIEAENDALYNKLYSKDWFIKLQEIDSVLDEGVSEKLYTVFYKNTAGEIEARDVSSRINFTEEQRNDIRPDIDRTNVTFSNYGESLYYIGDTKDGRRCYQSGFDSSVSMDDRIKAFKERIATIFNLGAVELKTDVKKIRIKGDRFTAQKNIYGDLVNEDGEQEAKINSLYDLADILATSKYDPAATNQEPSYANPSVKPKNKAHKGVKYWYKFRNEIVFDGVPYTVTFNIRDKGKDQYQYLIEFKENKTPGLSNTAVNNLLRTDQVSYMPTVPQDSQSVKQQFSISDTQAETEGEKESVDTPTAREQLPRKAQEYLKRAERKLLRDIAGVMNANRFADRSYLQEVVQQISEEYLNTGTVSQETLDNLFTQAYNQGIVVDTEFYNQFKEVKDYLRTMSVTLAQRDTQNIADWFDFRKRAFGTLRIVNEGGLPVDTAYGELRTMAPGLFPESITQPADQLLHMYEVGKSITKSEKSLKDYHSADAQTFRKWAKNDFDAAVGDVMRELQTVKKYADDKAAREAEEARKVPITLEELMSAYAQMKDARRTYEKTAAKNLLSEGDEMLVGRLLKGEILPEHLDDVAVNKKGVLAVYEAKLEYEGICRVIAEYKRKRKGELRKLADSYLKNAGEWVDKKVGLLYSRETMRRNIQDIVKDQKEAAAINDEFFDPIQVAEAESTRFKNWYRERVRGLDLSTKVRRGDMVSEAHAVQLLGEVQDNIRVLENAKGRIRQKDGKTLAEWRAVIDEMWQSSPSLDQEKIDSAVREFRYIYDQLFQQMNEVRVRNGYEPVNYRKGYFPHFQPGGDGIIAQFGKALGISTEVNALPTTINGLTHTFKPGIQWFGNAQERLGFNTAYDAVEGFDKYIEGVASVIHQTDNIQKLRALAAQVRYRTTDEGIRIQVDEVMAKDTLTEEEKQARINEIYEHGRFSLSNFVVELEEYTNLLANKKSKLDRTMEGLLGRRAYTVMKNIESRVGANMIAGNISSALTNIIPLTQASAQLDSFSLMRGMWSALQSYRQDDGLVGMSTFLTNRRGSDPLVRNWAEKVSGVLSTPMELIDTFVSDSIVRAAYFQNLRRGLSEAEAMHQADIFAASVMADRSKGSMPTLFESTNPIFKAFTQFQLEVNNQFSEVFKDIPRRHAEKSAAVLALTLLRYFLGAWLFDEVYEYFVGRRPALDPIDMLNNLSGDLTGYELPNILELGEGIITGEMPSFETEKVGFGKAMTNLATGVVEDLPFSSIFTDGGRIPVASAVPNFKNLWNAATDTEKNGKKRWKEAQDELNKLAYIIPPFGGNQISKIWKGVKAYVEGGSYSVDNEGNQILQYPVYKDEPGDAFWNLVRATIMGKSSLPEAQEWVNSGFDSFTAKQTAIYQDLLEVGVEDREAYSVLREFEGVEKTLTESKEKMQRKFLRKSDLADEVKAIIYYGMVASDKDQLLMDRLTDTGADPGAVAFTLMDIQDAENSAAIRDVIAAAKLTDTEKVELYRAKISDEQDADISALMVVGLDFNDYLEVYGKRDALKKDKSIDNKELEFSYWVDCQGYSEAQADAVKACFGDNDDYEKYVDRGLDPNVAYELADEIDDLKPVDGKKSVQKIQKWRVCVEFTDNVDDQMTALYAVMKPTEYQPLQIAHSFGVAPKEYVTLKEVLPLYDVNGNGRNTHDEITAAIDSLSCSNEVKAVLWQMTVGKTTKGKKNPYDKQIGQQVYEARQAAPTVTDEEDVYDFSTAIAKQWS